MREGTSCVKKLQRSLPSIQNTKIGSLKMKKLPQISPQGAAKTRSLISLDLSRPGLIGTRTNWYEDSPIPSKLYANIEYMN